MGRYPAGADNAPLHRQPSWLRRSSSGSEVGLGALGAHRRTVTERAGRYANVVKWNSVTVAGGGAEP